MLKSENHIVIQGWMCNELELKGNDLLVFALIYGFSQDGESKFYGGRKYIAETFNISLPTVDKALQSLLNKEYIIKYTTEDITETNLYWADLDVVKKLYMGSKVSLQRSSKETLLNKTSNLKLKDKIKSNSNELLKLPETEEVKKPNLYSKCLASIDTYTQDIELREYLKNMLDLRLEIARDEKKPFYFSMWTHLLKELTDLGGKTDVKLGKDIVLNSTSHGWKHFYEITDNNFIRNGKRQKKDVNVFGEDAKVKSEAYTDDELEEMERINKEREKKGMRTKF